MTRSTDRPPAIVIGGRDNALSIVRDLGRIGVPVYVANDIHSEVFASRFARRLPIPELGAQDWLPCVERFLLGSDADALHGAVVLAASDEALEWIAARREPLSARYLLDLSNPAAQLAMLDKQETYKIATGAGVPTPRYWTVDAVSDIEKLREELVYPLIVKPKLSHLFQKKYNSKFIVVNRLEELRQAMTVVEEANIDVMLVEKIPGPDSQLCSYYTYLDEDGAPQFDFTKRIIRRHPENMGLACYHVTDYVEGVKEESLKLFTAAGLLGVANAEFKLDKRDGQLKLIECNARFTAANKLLTEAGIPFSSFVYHRLIGQPHDLPSAYRVPLRMWDPARDFMAFRDLQKQGRMNIWKWLGSICHRQVSPSFAWDDPGPSWTRLRRRFGKLAPSASPSSTPAIDSSPAGCDTKAQSDPVGVDRTFGGNTNAHPDSGTQCPLA